MILRPARKHPRCEHFDHITIDVGRCELKDEIVSDQKDCLDCDDFDKPEEDPKKEEDKNED